MVEILIVISVIAVLSVIFLSALNPLAQIKKGRDTRRRSDLSEYRNALENFATANATLYPEYYTRQEATDPVTLCGVLDPDYLSDCPEDPQGVPYYYRSDGTADTGNAEATQFVLWTELETGGFWEVCSDGRSGVLPAGQSPAVTESDAGGNCAL